MAMNIRGLLGEGGAGTMPASSLLSSPQQPDYNVGLASFLSDPYQVTVMRPQLEQAGLWNPAWDAWASYQADGDSSSSAPAMPDLSSLAGYSVGYGDYGGGNRQADLLNPAGDVAVSNPYTYDEPSIGNQLAQGLGIVGGAALGMNAAFGGLGAASSAAASDPISAYLTTGAAEGSTVGGAAAGGGASGAVGAGSVASALAAPMELGAISTAEPLSLAGEYGAMGDPTALTGGALGTPAAEIPTFANTAPAYGFGEAGMLSGAAPAASAAASASPAASPTPGRLFGLNPRTVASIAGGLLGGASGGSSGYSYNGPMPTITRGGWSPTATPTYAQPMAQPTINRQPGQANSGLWRFLGAQ